VAKPTADATAVPIALRWKSSSAALRMMTPQPMKMAED
jgi:hypothetical protein